MQRIYIIGVMVLAVVSLAVIGLYMHLASASASAIPKQAIRLRILANSDSVYDQAVKRKVRDAIVATVHSWVTVPKTLAESRRLLQAHLPELTEVAQRVVDQSGCQYPVKVEYGKIPFPTKLYGDRLYPAGRYEGVLVTLGQGKGENWWCVLFPPLCFINVETGDAADAAGLVSQNGGGDAKPQRALQVRFFVLDKLRQLFSE